MTMLSAAITKEPVELLAEIRPMDFEGPVIRVRVQICVPTNADDIRSHHVVVRICHRKREIPAVRQIDIRLQILVRRVKPRIQHRNDNSLSSDRRKGPRGQCVQVIAVERPLLPVQRVCCPYSIHNI